MILSKLSRWPSLLVLSSLCLNAGIGGDSEQTNVIPVVEKPNEGEHRRDRKRGHLNKNKHRDLESKAFKAADKSGDGSLSFNEFSSLERLARLDADKRKRIFTFLDKNNDGLITQLELHPRPLGRSSPMMKNFNRLDVNGSGTLDFEEFQKSMMARNLPAKRLRHHFEKLDADNSGDLDKRELARSPVRGRPSIQFKKMDLDKNGSLSFEEYSSVPFINRFSEEKRREMFERIDKNNNQELSADEIKKARRGGGRRDDHRKRGRPPHGGQARGVFSAGF